MTRRTLETVYGHQWNSHGVNLGLQNSPTLRGVSRSAPDVVFPKQTVVTVQSAEPSLTVPELSIGAEWDESLNTLNLQAQKYVGPDTMILPWLKEVFGPDPKGRTTASLRTAVRLIDGEIKYHDVLALAREWDESGPSQPNEFVDAIRFEVDGTRQAVAVNSIMVNLTTGRSE